MDDYANELEDLQSLRKRLYALKQRFPWLNGSTKNSFFAENAHARKTIVRDAMGSLASWLDTVPQKPRKKDR